ncbi:glycosyltransferase family 4 protein [bacterium]|nr:glycosyltransferase family 4 protein [bacterium]
MNKSNRTVCIVGVFPPPIHGFALVNEAMKNLITSLDPRATYINLSSLSLSRTIPNISIRLFKFLLNYPQYMIFSILNKYHTLYIGLSGGFGQLYDLFILIIAKITNQRIFLHHHSFSYFNKYNLLTFLVIKIAGNNATHIVLCKLMQEKLKSYTKIPLCIVLSNSAFSINNFSKTSIDRRLKKIGFLGNISIEKGIKFFFSTLNELNSNRTINGIIGGPFQDKISETFTRNELKKYSYISYIGPIYDKEKEDFFKTIDVLLMPSVLEEAEPLVIHEAMSHGIPVIAYDKGCIPEIISDKSGLVINKNLQFVNNAIKLINNWIDNPNVFNKTRNNAINNHINIKQKNEVILEKLLLHITSTHHI